MGQPSTINRLPEDILDKLHELLRDPRVTQLEATARINDILSTEGHDERAHSFFFLDPPYWCIPGYKHDFQEQDFIDLAGILQDIKGKFLMTINDTPEVRAIFKQFTIQETTLKYSVNPKPQARAKTRTELLISNYG